jgi:predicted membrane chloride channel (bestrophin family)
VGGILAFVLGFRTSGAYDRCVCVREVPRALRS